MKQTPFIGRHIRAEGQREPVNRDEMKIGTCYQFPARGRQTIGGCMRFCQMHGGTARLPAEENGLPAGAVCLLPSAIESFVVAQHLPALRSEADVAEARILAGEFQTPGSGCRQMPFMRPVPELGAGFHEQNPTEQRQGYHPRAEHLLVFWPEERRAFEMVRRIAL